MPFRVKVTKPDGSQWTSSRSTSFEHAQQYAALLKRDGHATEIVNVGKTAARGLTAAQWGRQRQRNADGRYEEMPRCDGGCGRPVNVRGSYYSHPLTDCTDANGENFGGDALTLCVRCGAAAQRPEL